MTRRPRDPFYDKLVNHRLILLTYAQIGVIQTCAAFAAYFLCMMEHGFHWDKLVGTRTTGVLSRYSWPCSSRFEGGVD